MKHFFKKKRILVTGACGTVGSELVRQLLEDYRVNELTGIDNNESDLFFLEQRFSRFSNASFFLADVRDQSKMIRMLQGSDVVFHTAAFKHVILCERSPMEAVQTNILGVQNVITAANENTVERVIFTSSDKAVNPTNVMGTSKLMGERLLSAANGNLRSLGPVFSSTRFGNVLGSNGFVVPLFSKQIREGGPITVTHPEITRYFMTIPEACELVLEAGFMGHGGEIFVFDMGKPVKIVDLATQMIKLSGLVPGKDIEIVFTGLRYGEKLHEELLNDKETLLPTYHPKIKIAQVIKMDYTVVSSNIEPILNNLYSISKYELIELVEKIVPEYHNGTHKEKFQNEPLKIIR